MTYVPPSMDPDAPVTNRDLVAALATIQAQLDAQAAAHDARAAHGLEALDEIRDIVCDPLNPQSHDRRLTTVEARTDVLASAHSRAETGGFLGGITPTPETVGAYAAAFTKWGPRALVVLVVFAVLYSIFSGHALDQYERWRRIQSIPVQVDVNLPADPRVYDNTRRLDSLAAVARADSAARAAAGE